MIKKLRIKLYYIFFKKNKQYHWKLPYITYWGCDSYHWVCFHKKSWKSFLTGARVNGDELFNIEFDSTKQ